MLLFVDCETTGLLPCDNAAKNIISAEKVRKTGLPYYTQWHDVPEGLVSKTRAKQMKQKIQPGESPVAYALCRLHKGYIPLYRRLKKESGEHR